MKEKCCQVCKHVYMLADEEHKFFWLCANRKSDNFLQQVDEKLCSCEKWESIGKWSNECE